MSVSTLLPELVHTIPKINGTQQLEHSYDYVIVGGGTAGCLVAGRLCEDPSVSVLILEAGVDDRSIPIVRIPWYCFHLLNTDADWNRKTVPQKVACKALINQQSAWGLGKMLGGCFSHNAMHYVRGNAGDFDYWKDELGCEGWGYEEALKYFKKTEGNQLEGLDEGYHNNGGPIPIVETEEKETSKVTHAFLDGLNKIGIPKGDFNGSSQIRCSKVPLLKKPKERWSSVDAFVRPALKGGNLTVQTNAHVTRILLNDDASAAVGVEFQENSSGKPRTVKASREVIVCAGAVHSPQILMLSGMGPKDHLEDVGVKCLVDLPAVGQNLQDHIHVPIEFQSKAPTKTQESVETPENLQRWITHGDGPLAGAPRSLESTGFMHTGARPDLEVRGQPDIQLYCWTIGAGSSQKVDTEPNIFMLRPEFNRQDFSKDWLPNQFTLIATLLHPKSIGWVKLESTDPFASPLIDPQYLEDDVDVESLKRGLKKLLQLTQTSPMKEVTGPPTPQDKCPYEFGTDEYLEWVIRHFTYTGYHWVGTCAMGKDVETSVVDPNLRVHKVKGLSVCDGSIIPQITSGNTCAPILMVAEKGADCIKLRSKI